MDPVSIDTQNSNLDSPDVNVVQDIEPISIPEQDNSPSIDERIGRIEDVLHISE